MAEEIGIVMSLINNLYLWIGVSFLFVLLFLILFVFLIIVAKKTHAIIEIKSWIKGQPIALFFQENRYCEWRAVKTEAGIIQDKDYSAFIINERATYIDKLTKSILIPFDAALGASVNIHAAKIIDDLQYVLKDEEQLKKLRWAVANDMIDDSETIDAIKTSVHLGAIKNMTNALLPHNINSKIEKVIASRLKGFNKVNVPQIALLFVAIFGALVLGGLVIKFAMA